MIQSEQFESSVRAYCRDFPVVFSRARGARMRDVDGREYIDFFAGGGALNYGCGPERRESGRDEEESRMPSSA